MKGKVLKKVMASALALAMVFSVNTLSFAAEGAQGKAGEEAGYVEVKITYNDDYTSKFISDADKRLAKANENMNKKFSSLEDAANALSSLYYKDGNYESDYNYGVTGPIGPLFVHVNDTTNYPNDHVIRHPITSVEFIVHGEVPAYSKDSTGTITLGHRGGGGMSCIPAIKLTGADNNAKISGNAKITAYAAGGYASVFTEAGTFTVDGIEFTETSGNTTIEVDGSRLGDGDVNAKTTMTIQDCTFHNCLYSYVNDTTSNPLTKNIMHNKFVGNEYDGYAYFIQGQGTGLLFEGNAITGYERGLNIHFESDNAAVVISQNSISTDSADCGSVQLTNAKTVEVIGNDITNPSGAAIRFYNNLNGLSYNAEKTTITGNDINTESLFQKGTDGKDMVDFGDGMVLDFDVNENNISPDTDVYYGTNIWPVTVTGENVVFTPSPRTDSTIPVNDGSDLTVNFAAEKGYRVVDVKVDGMSVEDRDSYTFENVTAAHTIDIKTEKIPTTVDGDEGTTGDKTDNNTTGSSEDKTTVTKESNSPKTADPMTLGFLLAVMGASGAGVLGLKKRK